MATNIDDLQIEISASAKDANSEISSLVEKLSRLQKSLTSVGGSGFKNYTSNANKATNQTKSFGSMLNKMNNSANKTAKSTKSLAYAFGKFYANYFLFIRAFKGLFNSIESTADYIEAFNYFNVAIGKISSEWSHDYEKYGYENAEAYAESFNQRLTQALSGLSGVQVSIGADGSGLLTETGMKNLGLNIKEVTQYASQLASVTNSVGQTGEVSIAAAEAFTKLGADISSLFNLDYSAVMTNLQSGLIGQSRALYKYGIDITNATLQTYAYGLGLKKAVSEMTQAEKMQLRMIAILDQSKVAWGDLANTLNSPSNLIRQFTNNLKEAGMVLGQLFMPLLQKVLPVINGVTIAIKRLLVSIAGFLGISLDLSSFGQGYSDMADDASGLSDSLDDATESAKKLKTATLGIDELNINAPQDDTSGASGAVGGGIDLTDEILKATDEYQKFWQEAFDKMESRAQAFADMVEKFLEPIKKMFENLFSGNFEEAGENLSDFFMQLMDIDWDSVYSNASGFGTGLAEFLNGLISPELFGKVGETIASTLNTAIYTALSFVKEFDWKNFGTSLAEGVNKFFATFDFDSLAEGLNTFVDGLKDSIASFLETVSWKDIMSKVTKFLGDLELDTVAAIIGTILIKKIGAIRIANKVITAIGTGLSNAIAALGGIKLSTLALILPRVTVNLSNFALAFSPNLAHLWTIIEDQFLRGSIFDTNTWKGFPAKVDKAITEAIDKVGAFLVDAMKTVVTGMFNWDETINLFEQASKSFQNVKTAFEEQDWLSLGANIISGIVNGFAGGIAFILEPIHNLFTLVWDSICKVFGIHSPAEEMKPLGSNILKGIVQGFTDSISLFTEVIQLFWDESVVPWFTVEQWSLLWENVKLAFSEKWIELTEWWKEAGLYLWWTEDVEPWFTLEKWSLIWDNVKEAFSIKWNEIKKWWSTNALSKWWKDDVEPWFKKEKWNFDGIKEGLSVAWNSAIDAIKSIWNAFANWLNEKLTWTIEPISVMGKKIFDGATISLGRIPTFETGGFPEDGLFMANHNELVGQFSNGKTAVANNEQIVAGIKEGVREAVSEILAPYLSDIAQNTRETADKDFSVNIGDREIARANARGQRSLGYSLVT